MLIAILKSSLCSYRKLRRGDPFTDVRNFQCKRRKTERGFRSRQQRDLAGLLQFFFTEISSEADG